MVSAVQSDTWHEHSYISPYLVVPLNDLNVLQLVFGTRVSIFGGSDMRHLHMSIRCRQVYASLLGVSHMTDFSEISKWVATYGAPTHNCIPHNRCLACRMSQRYLAVLPHAEPFQG